MTLSQFSPQLFPADGFGTVAVEVGQPSRQFGLLRCCQRDVAVAEAIPQLANEREALLGAETRDFVGTKSVHAPNLRFSALPYKFTLAPFSGSLSPCGTRGVRGV